MITRVLAGLVVFVGYGLAFASLSFAIYGAVAAQEISVNLSSVVRNL